MILCIVSIFSDRYGDFVLTHNRDESRLRPFSGRVETGLYSGHKWTGPVDLVSGGTWIYYSDRYAACILNGAYEKHNHRPPYRMSRGLLILELLKYDSIDEFAAGVEPNGIEPFTMVMLSLGSAEKKILVWDGRLKFTEDHSAENLIVRSSTPLYTESEKSDHFSAFERLDRPADMEIFELHDRLKMLPNSKFETVQTTSISQIRCRNGHADMKFCPIRSSV